MQNERERKKGETNFVIIFRHKVDVGYRCHHETSLGLPDYKLGICRLTSTTQSPVRLRYPRVPQLLHLLQAPHLVRTNTLFDSSRYSACGCAPSFGSSNTWTQVTHLFVQWRNYGTHIMRNWGDCFRAPAPVWLNTADYCKPAQVTVRHADCILRLSIHDKKALISIAIS